MNKTCICIALLFCKNCCAEWTLANYEVFRDSNVVMMSDKVQGGSEHLNSWWCGVMINQTNLETTGLEHSWCRGAEVSDGRTYLIKTHTIDIYSPPLRLYHNSYEDERTYFTFVPGLVNAGTKFEIQVTANDPWYRFAIAFMDTVSNERPVKLKVWNVERKALFCRADGSAEHDTEETNSFPFESGKKTKVSFTVTSDSYEVDVDDNYFYSYKHRLSYLIVNSVGVWFEGIPDSLYLHSVDIYLPSLNLR